MNYQRVVITRFGGPDILKVVVEENCFGDSPSRLDS